MSHLTLVSNFTILYIPTPIALQIGKNYLVDIYIIKNKTNSVIAVHIYLMTSFYIKLKVDTPCICCYSIQFKIPKHVLHVLRTYFGPLNMILFADKKINQQLTLNGFWQNPEERRAGTNGILHSQPLTLNKIKFKSEIYSDMK